MSETKATKMENGLSSDNPNETAEPQTSPEALVPTQQVADDIQPVEKLSLDNQAGTTELKPITDGMSAPSAIGRADGQPWKELQTADQTDLAVSEPRDELPPPTDAGLLSLRAVEEPASVNEDANIKSELRLEPPLPPAKSTAIDEPRKAALLSENTIDEKPMSISQAENFQSEMVIHENLLDSVSLAGPEVNESIHSKIMHVKVGPELLSMSSASTNGKESEIGILPNGDTVRDTLVPGVSEDSPEKDTDHERLSKPDDNATGVPVENENMGLNAEFELDSSPIESSSSDMSTDSSSSEESDQDDYVMLDPAEQARRLMQEEGGSDDENGGKADNGAGSGPLRTLNEKPDEIVPKPDLKITKEMKISELGDVENLVENLILIKGKTSGEFQVLEFGSVLCLEDRSVIGVIAETLGRVQQPFYSVRFTNAAAISEVGISQGTKIFYVDQFSTYVFTQTLKAFKGSDASNLHDEEAGDAEIEFSDDEAEAEHKRKFKSRKQSRRDGRQGNDGFTQGVNQSWSKHQKRTDDSSLEHNNAASTKYEEKVEDDELYTPLARPPNLHEIMGQREAPIETQKTYHNADRLFRGDKARGDRGRGRGERGQGNRGSRGGFENRSRNGNDHRNRNGRGGPSHRNGNDRKSDYKPTNDLSQRLENHTFQSSPPPPPPPSNVSFRPYSAAQNSPLVPTTTSTFQPYPPAFPHQNYPSQHHDPYNQMYPQPQYHPPQSYPPPNYQQQQQQPRPQHPYPNHHHPQPSGAPYASYQPQFQTPPSNIPPGAHINPAFFSHQSPPNPPSYPPHQSPSYPPQQKVFRSGQHGVGVGGSGTGGPGSSKQQAGGHSPESDAVFRAAQQQLDVLRNLTHQGSGSPS